MTPDEILILFPPARLKAANKVCGGERNFHVLLTQDVEAVVDQFAWEEILSRYRWYAHLNRSVWVMRSNTKRGRGDTQSIYAHILIGLLMGFEILDVIDHRMHQPKDNRWIDNRLSNLRPATVSQNRANVPSDDTEGFRGVTPHHNRFRAQITVKHQTIYLGSYPHILDAAKAYDDAATFHFGEFACLNFPSDDIPF